MRRAAKVDSNQDEVVKALRAVGASVQSLAATGKGCPDLLVGFCGVNYLMEIKDGKKSPSEQRLTDDQVIWHKHWLGTVHVVNSSNRALRILGVVK